MIWETIPAVSALFLRSRRCAPNQRRDPATVTLRSAGHRLPGLRRVLVTNPLEGRAAIDAPIESQADYDLLGESPRLRVAKPFTYRDLAV